MTDEAGGGLVPSQGARKGRRDEGQRVAVNHRVALEQQNVAATCASVKVLIARQEARALDEAWEGCRAKEAGRGCIQPCRQQEMGCPEHRDNGASYRSARKRLRKVGT